ncbi:MAG: efflux RND transporter permease subunit [Bdellovibrionota bacterium]|jgi:multidrug efflux pump
MQLTDLFIRRPVLAICTNLIILVAGIQAIRTLPTRQYPKSDLSVVTVQTSYIGASADLIRGFVTTPLEQAIASADGIDYLESESSQNISKITAHLRLNYDTNSALTQIQSKVNQVRNDLPPEAEVPIINVESTDDRFASLFLSFSSDTMKSNQITDYLIRVVQPKLSAVPGVQRAEILGERTFAMRLWLKPDRMAAMKLSPVMVTQALKQNNYLAAIGSTKGSMVSVNLTANTDLVTVEDFENLVIKREGSSLVRVKDIADVEQGAVDYNVDVRVDGDTNVFIGVWVLPNANTLEVIKNTRKILPDIEKNLPNSIKFRIAHDSTEYIQDAIDEVRNTLIETVCIVVLVIFIFIGSIRSVLVPTVAIPLSLLGGVVFMALFGFTINLLTLLAIVLAVGLVVDDAIVMLENIERHVQEGMKPFDAAIKGARELVLPTIAMSLTLATVYAPIGFQGGLTGALFREFAFTLAGAVVVSGMVALTLSPMMSSRLIRSDGKETRFKTFVDSTFARLQARYEKALRAAMQWRVAILCSAALLIACIPVMYIFSEKELAPQEDQGIVAAFLQAAPDSTIDQTSLYTSQIAEVVKKIPATDTVFQVTLPNFGFAGVVLKPWGVRKESAEELKVQMGAGLAQLAGIRSIVITPPPLPGGSQYPVEMVISSTHDPKDLYQIASQVVQYAYTTKKFTFVDLDLKYDLPQVEFVLDRDMIASLGMDLRQVGGELASLTGGNYVNRYSVDGRSYKVIPQVKRAQRLTPEQLLNTYVNTPEGKLIPVSTFATIKSTVEPRQLNRFQQLNSVKIQGVVNSSVSIDSALTDLENKTKELISNEYTIDYAGESRQLRTEGSKLIGTLFVALILIYLVLAAQFESFRDPFIVLAGSVPLALAGSMVFVFFGSTSINIYSQVGLVTLVGLIAKNGILITEFANRLQEEGYDRLEAGIRAGIVRLRPVLMTSVATVVGHFPLCIASGAGAGARNSIGITLVSGMVIGTVFTLFVVPAIYSYVAKQHNKVAQ